MLMKRKTGVSEKDGTIYAWHRSEGRRYADGSGLRLNQRENRSVLVL